MSTDHQHLVNQLAVRLKSQLTDDAQQMGAQLLGSSQPDAHRVPREQYLAYIRRCWSRGAPELGQDAHTWREAFLQRVGPKNFLATAEEAWQPAIEAWTRMEQAALADPRELQKLAVEAARLDAPVPPPAKQVAMPVVQPSAPPMNSMPVGAM